VSQLVIVSLERLVWVVKFLDFELNELLIFVCLGWIGRDEDRHEHEEG